MTLQPTPIEEAFKAEVIADSISPYGIRLTTMQLRYPRFIHAEFMTHRQFSRNARSSRAVPTNRLTSESIYMPRMMRNQAGMQSFEELSEPELQRAMLLWMTGAIESNDTALALSKRNVHKQWANRWLETAGYIDVVVSSTFWQNFFNLRDHPAAMPEIQHLARAMRHAMDASIPRPLQFEEWHLPYVQDDEWPGSTLQELRLYSTARCARVSYKPFDAAEIDPDRDYSLANKLIVEDPLHASPAEHQATPDKIGYFASNGKEYPEWENPERHGNFLGWIQHRKQYPSEASNEDYSFETLLKYKEILDGHTFKP